MQSKLSPSNTTYLNLSFQAVESTGGCVGCFFRHSTNPCNIDTPCESHSREDNKEVIWVKVETPSQVSDNRQTEALTARNILNRQIEELCQKFYDDTGLRVDSINLDNVQSLGGKIDFTRVETVVKL